MQFPGNCISYGTYALRNTLLGWRHTLRWPKNRMSDSCVWLKPGMLKASCLYLDPLNFFENGTFAPYPQGTSATLHGQDYLVEPMHRLVHPDIFLIITQNNVHSIKVSQKKLLPFENRITDESQSGIRARFRASKATHAHKLCNNTAACNKYHVGTKQTEILPHLSQHSGEKVGES